MRTFLVAALVAAFSAPSLAQGAPTHTVPVASDGHVIELVVAGPAGATVAVVGGPSWTAFERPSADALPDAEGGDRVARFPFRVTENAPVGSVDEVAFEVRLGGAAVATHAVSLTVGPPVDFELGGPRPNPTRGPVVVPLLLPEAAPVRVAVYDVLGRETVVLVDAELPAGRHTVPLDTRVLAPGTYVVRALSEGRVPDARVRTLTVVR